MLTEYFIITCTDIFTILLKEDLLLTEITRKTNCEVYHVSFFNFLVLLIYNLKYFNLMRPHETNNTSKVM